MQQARESKSDLGSDTNKQAVKQWFRDELGAQDNRLTESTVVLCDTLSNELANELVQEQDGEVQRDGIRGLQDMVVPVLEVWFGRGDVCTIDMSFPTLGRRVALPWLAHMSRPQHKGRFLPLLQLLDCLSRLFKTAYERECPLASVHLTMSPSTAPPPLVSGKGKKAAAASATRLPRSDGMRVIVAYFWQSPAFGGP